MEITYILNTDNYTYEPYSDGGFSGKILLAKPKKEDLPKLLIKSENPSSACCEFMYSRLAELLRIPAPKAYIMDVSKKDKKLFGSPYVVGIEYMEGMRSFTLDEMRSSSEWKKEYAGQYALSAMFEQDDLVQLTMTADGHICGYDFTETFWLSDMTVRAYQLPEEQLTEILSTRLQASARQGTSFLSAGAAVVKKHFELPEDAPVPSEYLEPLRGIYALTEDDIEGLIDTLDEVYQMTVSVYIEEYLVLLQKKIAAYFKTIGEEI